MTALRFIGSYSKAVQRKRDRALQAIAAYSIPGAIGLLVLAIANILG